MPVVIDVIATRSVIRFIKSRSLGGFTERLRRKPKRKPENVVRRELSRIIES